MAKHIAREDGNMSTKKEEKNTDVGALVSHFPNIKSLSSHLQVMLSEEHLINSLILKDNETQKKTSCRILVHDLTCKRVGSVILILELVSAGIFKL